MFCFHEKMLKQTQEQAQEKGELWLSSVCACLAYSCVKADFHGEIRTCVLALVSALVLASLVKFFKSNCKNTQARERLEYGRNFWSSIFGRKTCMRWIIKDLNSDILTLCCFGCDVIFSCFSCAYEKALSQVNSVEVVLSLWNIPEKIIVIVWDFRLANKKLNA